MRTFQVVAISLALCAVSLAAPEAQNKRQALFVRQQRQQPSGYNFNRPDNPLIEDPAHDRQTRQAQSNLPLENVFRWFRGQFDDDRSQSTARKATRDSVQDSSADVPSRQYLPLPAQDKPRPFQPQPANPRPVTTRPSVPVTSFPSYQTTTLRPIITDSDSSAATNDEDHHHHGAHIENIDVVCAKDQMTIKLKFSGPFEGVIYSKGFYNQQNCRYLEPNSGRSNTEFTVSLDSCGTQFVDEFKTGGQAYLENVLVLQNEPGIQEVWDTIRRVRCLWAGNIKEALSTSLNVDVLSQEVVTFSGDTASARLDIQVGRGPFAAPANGLVKIGETMTLVVTVDGDPEFDISVGECVAHAGDRDRGGPVVKLTDADGCPLKAKLFPDPFQTTKDTQGTGAAVLAYAYFQAFKFPDQMELNIECEVELCKTGCRVCPRGKSAGRNKRAANSTETVRESLADPVRLVRKVHVVTDDDLALIEESTLGSSTIINVASAQDGICVSTSAFILGSTFLLVLLASASMTSACLWLKNQRVKGNGA
ncbi:cuticlin-3-like isoform X2 [Neocloeon triangulifer]|uniref:cuticlin-3-like isoform X2 n=1 Tax=Neocloeon triangulifer TaxID=2078957 RepID=UPI00286F696D|nr:cuticlin-3-like isoform X2 [Neocloeon triangulifer]